MSKTARAQMSIGQGVYVEGYRGDSKNKVRSWSSYGIVIDVTDTAYVIVQFQDFAIYEYPYDIYIFPFRQRRANAKIHYTLGKDHVRQCSAQHFEKWQKNTNFYMRDILPGKKYWRKNDIDTWLSNDYVEIPFKNLMRVIYNRVCRENVIDTHQLTPNKEVIDLIRFEIKTIIDHIAALELQKSMLEAQITYCMPAV
jgi:hypothetical protein